MESSRCRCEDTASLIARISSSSNADPMTMSVEDTVRSLLWSLMVVLEVAVEVVAVEVVAVESDAVKMVLVDALVMDPWTSGDADSAAAGGTW